MTISIASIADIPELITLINSAYRGDSSRKGWTTEADLLDGIRINTDTLTEYISAKDSVVLACRNDQQQIIGCVYLKQSQEYLYLGMLTVSPAQQGGGIGKLLLQASEIRAKESSCKKIMMTVISSRTELIQWYERRGYRDTGDKQPFPKDEKFGTPRGPIEFIVMEKLL